MLQVSPSAGNRQLSKDCSPSNPMLINDRSHHNSHLHSLCTCSALYTVLLMLVDVLLHLKVLLLGPVLKTWDLVTVWCPLDIPITPQIYSHLVNTQFKGVRKKTDKTRRDICHKHHEQRLCKIFTSWVKFHFVNVLLVKLK